MEGLKIMENKNNIDWNVNLNYITKDDLKTIYGFIPDADQTTIDNTKTDFTIMSIAISSERINTITGNQIEVIGFKNLNETQQQLVKRATARMTIYYLTDGMAFIRSSVSISGNGLSSSISPPSEPDYVLMEVYNLLQQANLHTPRKAINNPISCNTDNFNTPNIFDESDTRVITWDSGNKTFLRKEGLIAGTGIKIDDITDTIPKLKIHVDSNIDSLWEVDKDNPNFIKPKDDKGIDVNGKRIIDVGTPTFLSDATTKEYVDKKQDKLIAGTNITIDENNKISATGGKVDLSDYYKKEEVDKKLEDTKAMFPVAFQLNAIGQEIPSLKTTNKTVVGAINEIKVNSSSVDENRIFDNKEQKKVSLHFTNDIAIAGGQTFTYKNNPYLTEDNDIPNKKYVDNKVNDKQDKINDLDNRIFKDKKQKENIIELLTNAFYLANTLFDENEFYGTNTKELGNKIHLNANGIVKILKTKNIPELETFYKTIIGAINELNKRIPKIKSKTLNINEVDNTYDIELKNNPTPSPNISNWKEVGEVITDKNNNNQNYIKYIFKDKTHYRIYISYGDYTTKENNKNYSWQIINFYYQLDTSVVKSSLWIANNNNNQQTEINIYNIRIMWGMGRDYIFKKLEELQE